MEINFWIFYHTLEMGGFDMKSMKLLNGWIMCTILAFILLFSMVGNFLGYRVIYFIFDKYNDSRLDPLGENTWQLRSMAHGAKSLVILGDSHARGWKFQGDDVLNLGIPSQTSNQIRLRSDSYRDILSGKRLIVIAGGNDITSASTNSARKDEIVRNCLQSLEAIILNHQANFNEIVLVTIPPIFSMPFKYYLLNSQILHDAHYEINQGIRALAVKHGVKLLDAYKILSEKMKSENFSKDGIHLNRAAYQYLELALVDG
jgi:lysophospholipase L1-like esterase